MELHDLFSMEGDAWFKKGDNYYSVKQVQKIMREVLRVDPEHAQEFFDGFKLSKKR